MFLLRTILSMRTFAKADYLVSFFYLEVFIGQQDTEEKNRICEEYHVYLLIVFFNYFIAVKGQGDAIDLINRPKRV